MGCEGAGDVDAEILDPIRPGANRRAFPGGVGRGGEEGAFGDDLRAPTGQPLFEQRVGGAGCDPHGARITGFHPFDAANEHFGDWRAGRGVTGHAFGAEGEGDVFGGHNVTIMEPHAFAQGELHHRR